MSAAGAGGAAYSPTVRTQDHAPTEAEESGREVAEGIKAYEQGRADRRDDDRADDGQPHGEAE